MFERYRSALRRLILIARSESLKAGVAAIGPELLLLALLQEENSILRRRFTGGNSIG